MAIKIAPFFFLNFAFSTAIRISDRSLHIRIQRPIGIFFKPIEVPWNAIRKVELKRTFFGSSAVVTVKEFSPVLIFYFGIAQMAYEEWSRAFGNA